VIPEPQQVERFRSDLDRLVPGAQRLGISVSGGPDSLALLLLASAARPGLIGAATVDHALREESRGEAEMVAALCRRLGVPHCILTAEWSAKPASAIQERARAERYRLLGRWAEAEGLGALLTAHHADDQAETLLMRLSRGAGVRGLAAMRCIGPMPGSDIPLVRPLLGWRRRELEEICTAAGLDPAHDPSNADDRFERIRVRRALMDGEWLNAAAVARSAAHLAEADAALDWAADLEWARNVTHSPEGAVYRPWDAPPEIRRRIVARIIERLGTEGPDELRGRELDGLLATLTGGGTATLRGLRCSGGDNWRFARAQSRRAKAVHRA